VQVEWQASQPQLSMIIDRRRASELGVSIERLEAVLRTEARAPTPASTDDSASISRADRT
jgi:multidrug efflux pump subunit AcrB